MTKRQLRRLALQTSRYPSWRPVLQDALLEMYPEEFGRAIGLAESSTARATRRGYEPFAVFFIPKWMATGHRSPFMVLNYPDNEALQDLASRMAAYMRLHNAEIVTAYIADPTRYL